MASTRPFSHLDWPHTIKRVPSSGASLDGTSLEPVDPDGTAEDIDGHLDTGPQEEADRTVGGVLNQGEAFFFTENTSLDIGDFLDVHYDDQGNTVKRWKVLSLENEHRVVQNITDIKRRQFKVKLEAHNP